MVIFTQVNNQESTETFVLKKKKLKLKGVDERFVTSFYKPSFHSDGSSLNSTNLRRVLKDNYKIK